MRVTCSTRPTCRWCGSMRMRTSICTTHRSRATFTACPSRFCCNSCAAPGSTPASIGLPQIGECKTINYYNLSTSLSVIGDQFREQRDLLSFYFIRTCTSSQHQFNVIVIVIVIGMLSLNLAYN